MLTHPTLDTLRALKLDGMAEAFTELQTQDGSADLTHAEWLGLPIDREAISRETKRFESRMRTARLRHIGAAPEDVDYKTRRGLDKALFQSLLSGKWIKDKRNLMITGPCGVGKTWLACALAQAACRDGVTVLYKRTTRLFDELELAHGDGRFPRVFKALTKTQLLILDDWGPDRLNASQRRDLMEIVEDRYGNGSILITSQLPLNTWHEIIGEPTFADAILDRLVHNAYRLELDGQSFRKKDPQLRDETPDKLSIKNQGLTATRQSWADTPVQMLRMLSALGGRIVPEYAIGPPDRLSTCPQGDRSVASNCGSRGLAGLAVDRLAIGVVSRQTSRSMEDGHCAVGVFVDADPGLDVMAALRLDRRGSEVPGACSAPCCRLSRCVPRGCTGCRRARR